MHNLKDRLSTRINKHDIEELCRQDEKNSPIIEKLYQLSADDDEKTSWNALWALNNLKISTTDKGWLNQKHNELIDRAMKEPHSGKRRLILNLLQKQEFHKETLRTDFIDFCLKQILSDTETAGCKALYIKLAYKQCIYYKELIQELKLYIEQIMQEPISPAVKSAAINIRKNLNQYMQ